MHTPESPSEFGKETFQRQPSSALHSIRTWALALLFTITHSPTVNDYQTQGSAHAREPLRLAKEQPTFIHPFHRELLQLLDPNIETTAAEQVEALWKRHTVIYTDDKGCKQQVCEPIFTQKFDTLSPLQKMLILQIIQNGKKSEHYAEAIQIWEKSTWSQEKNSPLGHKHNNILALQAYQHLLLSEKMLLELNGREKRTAELEDLIETHTQMVYSYNRYIFLLPPRLWLKECPIFFESKFTSGLFDPTDHTLPIQPTGDIRL